jgi:hypothetical protein
MPEGLAADIALEVLRAPLEEELPREASRNEEPQGARAVATGGLASGASRW